MSFNFVTKQVTLNEFLVPLYSETWQNAFVFIISWMTIKFILSTILIIKKTKTYINLGPTFIWAMFTMAGSFKSMFCSVHCCQEHLAQCHLAENSNETERTKHVGNEKERESPINCFITANADPKNIDSATNEQAIKILWILIFYHMRQMWKWNFVLWFRLWLLFLGTAFLCESGAKRNLWKH